MSPAVRPHPWSINGAVQLTDPDPVGARRPPVRVCAEDRAGTQARMVRDAHRSRDGVCVRCDVPWPGNKVYGVPSVKA
ncbi:hypothetical protein AB0D56_38360, partial [Streptomyces sp. NPDC048209]|uniref:hypothetical protein n=1 Tax=Streptomyces sp. NPDC048209 TaxID=3156689 RepID=UPI00343D2CD2